MGQFDYVLIVGQGRSGTNWLLQLFDESARTFCRNEPYGAPESRLNQLVRHRWVVWSDQSELEECWDDAMRRTRLCMGDRDPTPPVPKEHLYEWGRRFGPYRMVRGNRLRRTLSALLPSLRGQEWPVPWWLARPAKLEQAVPVIKLVAPPGWASFVLKRRPGNPVIHIVRHPGGFLNSWSKRYLAPRDREAVRRDSVARLRDVIACDPKWGARMGDLDAMGVDECELWYWCYANETIHEAGQSSRDYHHVVYEHLVRDPVGVVNSLYAACGLPWNEAVERSIRRSEQGPGIADAWQKSLSPEQLRLVERFRESAEGFYYSEAAH